MKMLNVMATKIDIVKKIVKFVLNHWNNGFSKLFLFTFPYINLP